MRRKEYPLILASILVAILIFCFDNLMPLGVAGGVPYVLLVLLGIWFPKKRHILILATIGTALTAIGYFTSPPGGIQWVVLSNRLLAVFAIWVTAILIIARKRETDQRLQNEFLLENHINHTPMAAITWDKDFCVNSWNPAAEKIFGYSFDEAKGLHAKKLILPESVIANVDTIWHELKTDKGGRRSSNYNTTKNGKTISCEWYNTPLTDKNGEFSGVASLVMDITKRVEAERKIVYEKNTAQSYLDTIQVILVVLDDKGIITLINKKGCEMLGYEENELIGKNWFDTCLPDSIHNEVKAVFAQIINGDIQGVEEYENTVITKDQRILTLHFYNNFIEDDDENITNCIFSAHDVTEINKMQNDLIATKEYAESANQAKSDFLSHMSHELRTPLNAILGFSQLLEISDLDPKYMDSVNEIHMAGEHLLEVINEVLQLSHIESGMLEVHMNVISLTELLNECTTLIKPLADKQNIIIDNQINDTNCTLVEADKIRLKEVLLNFLSNAIKYNSAQGRITISCETTDDKRARIIISDTGEGLTNEQLQQLFTPYERFASNKNEIQGTGIGLVICKKLAELMNGSIGASSEPEKGSHFWIELNIPQQANIENIPLQ